MFMGNWEYGTFEKKRVLIYFKIKYATTHNFLSSLSSIILETKRKRKTIFEMIYERINRTIISTFFWNPPKLMIHVSIKNENLETGVLREDLCNAPT